VTDQGFDPNLANQATDYLVNQYSPGGTRIGWLMIASIFIEAWDLYSISFVLIFLERIYHPSALLLGLAAASTKGGAVIGALAGGWLTDRLGRRVVFLGTMVMFFIFGVAQAFSPNMTVLVILRLILGIPLGMDIANGYTYIMEYMQKGKREVMGKRWQFVFAVGEVVAILFVLLFLSLGMAHAMLWRVMLGLSGLPALILFFLRLNLPETAIWLVQRGRFKEAKAVSQKCMAMR
jgi:MFS family permease